MVIKNKIAFPCFLFTLAAISREYSPNMGGGR
jgi:hypothetical protein